MENTIGVNNITPTITPNLVVPKVVRPAEKEKLAQIQAKAKPLFNPTKGKWAEPGTVATEKIDFVDYYDNLVRDFKEGNPAVTESFDWSKMSAAEQTPAPEPQPTYVAVPVANNSPAMVAGAQPMNISGIITNPSTTAMGNFSVGPLEQIPPKQARAVYSGVKQI